jgi:hypothetical protein
MQSIAGRYMAGAATVAHAGAKKCMRERFTTELIEVRPLMIAVAGHAVLLDQYLVERGPRNRLGNRYARGRANSDVLQGMA